MGLSSFFKQFQWFGDQGGTGVIAVHAYRAVKIMRSGKFHHNMSLKS